MTGEPNNIREHFAAWRNSAEATALREVCSAEQMEEIAFIRGAQYGCDAMHSAAVTACTIEIARAK